MIGALAVALVLVAGPASASFVVTAIDDPVVCTTQDPDPWTQEFIAEQTDPFANSYDLLAMRILSGPVPATEFQLPPIGPHVHNYNLVSSASPGWHEYSSTATLIVAVGQATPRQTFSLDFSGAPAENTRLNPLRIVVDAYLNGHGVASMYGTYYLMSIPVPNNPPHIVNTWIFTDAGLPPGPPPVPEPLSMVMLGCLGAGMAAARKLRGKKV